MRGLKLSAKRICWHWNWSHLLQMRGLKRDRTYGRFAGFFVASFTDAWIETAICFSIWRFKACRIFYRCVDWNLACRPISFTVAVASFTDAWIETLTDKELDLLKESHLLQMRGLKPSVGEWRLLRKVASFTDAWIETWMKTASLRQQFVASFTDAWIETYGRSPLRCPHWCRIFYRCVDWNMAHIYIHLYRKESHLLQMRGLKPCW